MAEHRRTDGHLTVYLAWPLLTGLALAVVGAVSVGGIELMRKGALANAARAAGWTFFIGLGGITLVMFVYVAGEWAGPRFIEWIRTYRTVEHIEPTPPVQPEPPIRFIPIGGRARRLTEPPPTPMLPSGEEEPKALDIRQKVAGFLAERLSQRARITTYDQEVPALSAGEDAAPVWCREMLDILCATYMSGDLTRRTFEHLFRPGGTALWYRYVNGTGTGHRGKSVFQLWGIISQTGPRGSWEYCQPWHVIVSLDRELHAYAKMHAVEHSPTGRGGAQNGAGVQPNQTKPKNQSNYQSENQCEGESFEP